ncbi:helix-turn-helix transcriptional regulator [Streptomyces sp. HNM0575]|uniref:PAS and helix-turn-helix domain-containing protein n=1 Tax=Streptomyces sp. HNM0575 TaxID=2716338 RepID=UPI00145EE6CA|nr:PAS and helix-turn-helix domain-containing protein [Streptomyces sp. HNM0575]NLU76614.1 helix-turn-helix transcriptional regulator [Streptomyces sp. HNM0575]
MASLDPDLVIQQTNREFSRQFGTPSAEVCGLNFRDLVHPSVKQPLLRQFSGLIEGKRQLFDTHVVAVRPEESAAFVGSLTAAAVSGDSPQVSAVLIFMRASEKAEDVNVLPARKKLLSDIDARILEGIAAGLSTIHLASRLYLSRQGVEYHVTGLLRKLRVPNRAALVSRAYSMGVLNVGTWPPKVVQDFVK